MGEHSNYRQTPRQGILVMAALAVGGLVAPLIGLGAAADAAVPASTPTAHPPTDPYHFDGPSGLAVNGGLWVTNRLGNSLTEVNGTTGAFEHFYSRSSYHFSGPDAIVSDGADLFVANHGGSVTEVLASNGSLVQSIRGSNYHFASPDAIVRDGSDLFVVNAGGSLTEITTTGMLVRTVSGTKFGFDNPTAIAVAGPDLFVANEANNSVTEVAAATGALVRTITAVDALSQPDGIGSNGTYVWVADAGNDGVTQLQASTGSLVQVINSGSYGFWSPATTLVHGGMVYVASPPGGSPMVTGFTATSASGLSFSMCNTNSPYFQFSEPSALAVSGSDLWVANSGPNGTYAGTSLTEMNATTGAPVGTGPIS